MVAPQSLFSKKQNRRKAVLLIVDIDSNTLNQLQDYVLEWAPAVEEDSRRVAKV